MRRISNKAGRNINSNGAGRDVKIKIKNIYDKKETPQSKHSGISALFVVSGSVISCYGFLDIIICLSIQKIPGTSSILTALGTGIIVLGIIIYKWGL